MELVRNNMLFILSSALLALLIAVSTALQQNSASSAGAPAPEAAQPVAANAATAPVQTADQPTAQTTPPASPIQPAPTVKPSVRGRFFDDEGSGDD